jgi:hypothetical protein
MALDLTAPKSPPAKATPKTPAKQPGIAKDTNQINSGRMKTCVETVEGFAGIFAILGMHADAGMLMMHGGQMADAAVSIGEEHEKVGDAIDILGKNSVWMKLLGVGMVVGAQFGVNHGWIKNADRMAAAGVVSPETLITMSKTKLAEIELEAQLQYEASQRKLSEMNARRSELNGQSVSV